MHLGDVEPLADLRLVHVAAEVHGRDLLPARGQLAPVHGDGVHREHVLRPRVLLPEGVGQGTHGGLADQRRDQALEFKPGPGRADGSYVGPGGTAGNRYRCCGR